MMPMKVLWITNILFPEAISLINNRNDLKSSGGWMLGLANSLQKETQIELSVATVSPFVKSLTILKGKNTTYYVIPLGKGNFKYNKEYEPYWEKIYHTAKPDIVHIHGTEFSHGLAFMNACPKAKVVISIQGLTSAYYYYYYYGLKTLEIIQNTSCIELLKSRTLFHAKNIFKSRGLSIEIPMIKKAKHIIGRTEWDKSHTWAINPNARYHFCNEILRNEFYTGCWKYSNCEKHTLFLSQAGYPIKGLHMLLKAMPLILREFPDTMIKVGGNNITAANSIKQRLLMPCYGRIIKKLIKKYSLEKQVVFLNPLNAEEMKNEYLKCNVFVCPSTIENSPNSLGEAQLLGVPCVASYVGGVADMIPTSECGKMYRFEEVEMLAECIIDTFKESETFDNTTMKKIAADRHDRKKNAIAQYNIYKSIIDEEL